MVDTIGIRIHNLQNYKALYEQYYVTGTKKNTVVEGYNLVDVDGVVAEKSRSYTRSRFYQDSGKFLPINFSTDIFAPSCHYSVRCRFVHKSLTEITMEVELSLPKYFFATNLFQFVGFPEQSSEANFLRLLNGVRRLMRDLFFQLPSDYDVEIFRVDLCYNQFFNSKADALGYQKAQSAHMRQTSQSKNVRFVDGHGQNWSLVTDRYSFKCYHKGAEFRKNDLPQLQREFHRGRNIRNKVKGKYDLSYLCEVADRVLRYEITFRGSMIHYLTMYHTFESVGERPYYIRESTLHKYVYRAARFGNFAKVGEAFNYKITSPVEMFCSKVKKFFLKSDFDRSFSPAVILSAGVTFNYCVYRLLFDFFWTKVKEAQVLNRSSVPEMVAKIEQYKERLAMKKKAKMTKKKSAVHKGGVHLSRLLIPALLSQSMDLRQLKEFLPVNTYHKLMGDLKRAGIGFSNTESTLVVPRLDFQDNAIYLLPLIRDVL